MNWEDVLKNDIEKFFGKPKRARIDAQKILINGIEVPKEIAELAVGEAKGAKHYQAGGTFSITIKQKILDKYMKDYDSAFKKSAEFDEILKLVMADKELFDDYFTKMIELVGFIQGNKMEEAEKAWKELKPAIADVQGFSHEKAHGYLDRVIND